MERDRPEPTREELERLLRSDPLERPEARFRAAQRSRFLNARSEDPPSEEESASRPMQGSRTRSAMRDQIEDLIASTPLSAPADRAFRDELAERFVLGEEGEDHELRPVPAASGGWKERLRQGAVLLVAAAAVLVVLMLPEDKAWRVLDIQGSGELALDTVPVQGAQRLALGSTLHYGATLESGDVTLDLEVPGWLRLRMLPDTEIDLAPLPEDSDEPLWLSVARGEVFLQTYEGHPENPIHVVTDESRVVVTGTTLGVLRIEQGTCTCVAEGEVQVEDRVHGGVTAVGTEEKHFIFGPPEVPVMHVSFPERGVDGHTDALRDFLGR